MTYHSDFSKTSFNLNFYKPGAKCLMIWATFFLSFFCFLSVSANDILVKNPGNHNDIQSNLQAAVDKAVNGDRVILPEGEFVFNRSVKITKFISVIGKGLKKTILYRSESVPDSILSSPGWKAILDFEIRNDLPSHIIVSDICFRGKKPALVARGAGSRASTIGILMYQCVDFIIEKCRFEYFGNSGIMVRHKDTLSRGLIRKNEFYYNARFGLGYGISIYGEGKQWVADPEFGSSNFIFIEDNMFDFHRHSVASSHAALFVVRYNIVLNNIAASGGHAIDMHEARPDDGDTFGTRAMEVYNNKLINTKYTDGTPIKSGIIADSSELESSGIAIRNGDALVYNNVVKGYTYAVQMSNWSLRKTKQPYPVIYSPGYLSGKAFGPDHTGIKLSQSDGDAFIWNNKSNPYLKAKWDKKSVFHNDEPDWWKEGRDYHLEIKPGYKAFPYPYPLKNNLNN